MPRIQSHSRINTQTHTRAGVATLCLKILRLLGSFIKTDYNDPEVLIFRIKWSCFYTNPQGCTSFPTTSNLKWDLATLKYNLNCFSWLNRHWQAEQSWAEYKPSTQPLATVDTRLKVRYLWVAWHLTQRDSPADLGRGGRSGWRQTGWLCLCFPFRLIFYGWYSSADSLRRLRSSVVY